MCGITAIIDYAKIEPKVEDIKSMTNLLAHRGPDGEGFYIGGGVALGHRRLAIIDTDPRSDQPMHRSHLHLVFNGMIYNYLEIKEELSTLGATFSTTSDTEVILAAYNQWGLSAFERFNGMWAIILYDEKEKKIICSRDRFGIKPANALFGMHFDPLNFFYDGLIPSVGLTLIAALPKTGKSWFVLNLAKHMDANGLPVHYLAAEDNERRLKDRIEKVFKDGVKYLTYHAVMSADHPLPRGKDALFYIEQIVKGTGAKCVIIDTVQSILNPSANNKNYDQTVEEYDALRKLAHRLGIAMIVVHHCKKSSDVATTPLEKVIGSIGITGTAETILVMEQRTGSKDCKLNVTGKDVEQCDKYLSWNGHGFNIDDDVYEAQLGPFQRLVLNLIKESPRCMQKSIVVTTGKDQSQVSKAIDKLVEVGLVVKKEGRLIAQ